jgi:hypothetical protein
VADRGEVTTRHESEIGLWITVGQKVSRNYATRHNNAAIELGSTQGQLCRGSWF